jgi:hypothetical protein
VGLPVNTCAQVVGLTAGFHFAGEGLAYFLHRTKASQTGTISALVSDREQFLFARPTARLSDELCRE